MKVLSICIFLLPVTTSGFSLLDKLGRAPCLTPLDDDDATAIRTHTDANVGRMDFVKTLSVTSAAAAVGLLGFHEPALATGRATLEQSYERYAPRIKAGGEFYQGDFKQLVAKGDWIGIKEALGGVPPRKKEDLSVRP